MIWVGGAFYGQLLAIRVARSPDPSELPKLARHIEYLGTRVFIPASIILFIAGAYMTTQRWAFEQTWVSIAIVLWLASALTGAIYLGPRIKRVAVSFDTDGPASVLVIVALMVAKPTVG